jgi:hypothetical protein
VIKHSKPMNQNSNTIYPLRFSNIDMNELLNLMKNMKDKASGVNNMNGNVIMNSIDVIG